MRSSACVADSARALAIPMRSRLPGERRTSSPGRAHQSHCTGGGGSVTLAPCDSETMRLMWQFVTDSPATPRYLCKVRRWVPRKEIQDQELMRTALNPRSAEVWRQTAGERNSGSRTDASQCEGFSREAHGIGLPCALASQQRISVAEGLAEGEIPSANSLFVIVPTLAKSRELPSSASRLRFSVLRTRR
jgi:hypothetical protein